MSHPNKEISAAIDYAEKQGWRIEKGGGHAWGKMYCPNNDSTCRCGVFCIKSIWSTPKNPTNFAKQIKQAVDNCIYEKNKEDKIDSTSKGINDERI